MPLDRNWETHMKITGIEVHVVNMGHRNIPFVTVQTNEGISGVGEAYSCGPDLATVETVKDFKTGCWGATLET